MIRKTRWSFDEMVNAIKNSITVSDILKKIGLKVCAGNYDTVRKFIRSNNIDSSHIIGKRCGRGGCGKKFENDIKEILIENSNYGRKYLKKRLIESGLLKNECHECELKNEWNGKPITMVLDHINGINNDNRIENLRLLCPNCNSQQDTFCRGKYKKAERLCKCGNKMHYQSKMCLTCRGLSIRRANRPSKEKLEKLINSMSWVSIGKKYNVSDNSIRKWAKQYGIIK